MKSVEEQLALIRRGVDQIVPEEELKKKLERSVKTGKPLRVKYGIDPTGIDVHLGHTVPLRKLKLFQELGHQAVLIIGNYTALVGDPSGRDQARTRLTEEKVEENARDYLKQVSKVIDIDTTEVRKNGDWFSKYTFLDVLTLTSKITMQRMLERDDFEKRIKSGTPIYMHECMYPLMQGQDSAEIQADVELGGSEQLFSLMTARDMQRDAGQEPQVCITLPILRGTDGVRRMGKSLGNYIGVAEKPFDMLAKTMNIPDELLQEWFMLLTDFSQEEIDKWTKDETINPRDAKLELAKAIVAFYYGDDEGQKMVEEWDFQKKQKNDPTDIPVAEIPVTELDENGEMWVCKLLNDLGFAKSNGEARRLVAQGGVTIGRDRTKVIDPKANLKVTNELIVRSGKKNIAQIRLKH